MIELRDDSFGAEPAASRVGATPIKDRYIDRRTCSDCGGERRPRIRRRLPPHHVGEVPCCPTRFCVCPDDPPHCRRAPACGRCEKEYARLLEAGYRGPSTFLVSLPAPAAEPMAPAVSVLLAGKRKRA